MNESRFKWIDFLGRPAAAPLLYVLSAACLLAGIAQIVAPVYHAEGASGEKLAAVAITMLQEQFNK